MQSSKKCSLKTENVKVVWDEVKEKVSVFTIARGVYQRTLFDELIKGQTVKIPINSGGYRRSFKEMIARMLKGGYVIYGVDKDGGVSQISYGDRIIFRKYFMESGENK